MRTTVNVLQHQQVTAQLLLVQVLMRQGTSVLLWAGAQMQQQIAARKVLVALLLVICLTPFTVAHQLVIMQIADALLQPMVHTRMLVVVLQLPLVTTLTLRKQMRLLLVTIPMQTSLAQLLSVMQLKQVA